MLRKMGWREGEGLGKDRSGEVDPLQLDIKMDKKGLISAEEMVGRGETEIRFFPRGFCKMPAEVFSDMSLGKLEPNATCGWLQTVCQA